MQLSHEFVGASARNGFPVVLVHLDANVVVGKSYAQFNREFAAVLKPYTQQGMVNVILLTKQPLVDMPTLDEIRRAIKTKEGRFLEEVIRQLVLVGFKNKIVQTIISFSSLTTGVKVKSVSSLDEAYSFLKVTVPTHSN